MHRRQMVARDRMAMSRTKKGIKELARAAKLELARTSQYVAIHPIGADLPVKLLVGVIREYLRPDRNVSVVRGVLTFRNDVDARTGLISIRFARPKLLAMLSSEDRLRARFGAFLQPDLLSRLCDWAEEGRQEINGWHMEPESARMVQDIATRYLRGPISIGMQHYETYFCCLWRKHTQKLWREQFLNCQTVDGKGTIDAYHLWHRAW